MLYHNNLRFFFLFFLNGVLLMVYFDVFVFLGRSDWIGKCAINNMLQRKQKVYCKLQPGVQMDHTTHMGFLCWINSLVQFKLSSYRILLLSHTNRLDGATVTIVIWAVNKSAMLHIESIENDQPLLTTGKCYYIKEKLLNMLHILKIN